MRNSSPSRIKVHREMGLACSTHGEEGIFVGKPKDLWSYYIGQDEKRRNQNKKNRNKEKEDDK
jgi:hypothetical protein